jgi:polygalacturonase
MGSIQVVTNCTIVTKSSALVVGVEANAPLRNITFSNCVIRNSNRGLSVNLGEDSVFENITFSNIFIETRVWGHQCEFLRVRDSNPALRRYGWLTEVVRRVGERRAYLCFGDAVDKA